MFLRPWDTDGLDGLGYRPGICARGGLGVIARVAWVGQPLYLLWRTRARLAVESRKSAPYTAKMTR